MQGEVTGAEILYKTRAAEVKAYEADVKATGERTAKASRQGRENQEAARRALKASNPNQLPVNPGEHKLVTDPANHLAEDAVKSADDGLKEIRDNVRPHLKAANDLQPGLKARVDDLTTTHTELQNAMRLIKANESQEQNPQVIAYIKTQIAAARTAIAAIEAGSPPLEASLRAANAPGGELAQATAALTNAEKLIKDSTDKLHAARDKEQEIQPLGNEREQRQIIEDLLEVVETNREPLTGRIPNAILQEFQQLQLLAENEKVTTKNREIIRTRLRLHATAIMTDYIFAADESLDVARHIRNETNILGTRGLLIQGPDFATIMEDNETYESFMLLQRAYRSAKYADSSDTEKFSIDPPGDGIEVRAELCVEYGLESRNAQFIRYNKKGQAEKYNRAVWQEMVLRIKDQFGITEKQANKKLLRGHATADAMLATATWNEDRKSSNPISTIIYFDDYRLKKNDAGEVVSIKGPNNTGTAVPSLTTDLARYASYKDPITKDTINIVAAADRKPGGNPDRLTYDNRHRDIALTKLNKQNEINHKRGGYIDPRALEWDKLPDNLWQNYAEYLGDCLATAADLLNDKWKPGDILIGAQGEKVRDRHARIDSGNNLKLNYWWSAGALRSMIANENVNSGEMGLVGIRLIDQNVISEDALKGILNNLLVDEDLKRRNVHLAIIVDNILKAVSRRIRPTG